jgi:biotin operon repressor
MQILNLLPLGKENAITTEKLRGLSGCKSNRELQAEIEKLRKDGVIIASKSNAGGGYFIPEGEAETREFYNTLRSRAISTLATLKHTRLALKEFERKTGEATDQGN